MVEIRHLKLIEAINRLGSMKNAAIELHLTQSALSHQLKQLEGYVGSSIFYRNHNELTFTQFGEEFCKLSKEVLAKIDHLEDQVEEHRHRIF